MQNDPNQKNSAGSSSPRQYGRSAAERRAERRAQRSGAAPEEITTGASSSSNTQRTQDRRAERERERRRQRIIRWAIVIGALALVLLAVIIVTTTPDEAPVPETARTLYADLPQSQTTEGYPLLGNPVAPVVVSLYSSFDAENARTFHDALIPQLVERVRAEQVAIEFVPLFARGDITNGQGAARAAVCAAQQNFFWPFQDMLYSWIGRYPNNLVFRNNRITAGVNNIGMNSGQFDACRGSGRPDEVLERARLEAAGLVNFGGVPTVALNGVVPVDSDNQAIRSPEGILAAVDEAIARILGGETPLPGAEVTPEATAEAAASSAAEVTPEVTPETMPEATAEATPAS